MTKELEALEKGFWKLTHKGNINFYNIVEKGLRALEIIKEKTLTINDLYWLEKNDYKGYKKNLELLYKGYRDDHLKRVLKTQEEFDLLKEVLL